MNLMVPMRDRVRLATDLYQPAGLTGKLPVVLIRLPYNKATYRRAIGAAGFFAGQGYVVVTQDVRGQFQSEGEYQVENDDAADGYDTIDWIVRQPWSNGKVGTYGCSYLGEVQLLLAKRRHPNHLTMIAQGAGGAVGPAGGFFTNWAAYEGGALALSTTFGWFGYAGHQVRQPISTVSGQNIPQVDFSAMLESLPVVTMAERAGFPRSEFDEFVANAPADRYWTDKGYLTDQDRFSASALHINTWFDATAEQTLYVAGLMQRNGTSAAARTGQYVIMAPTTHCSFEAATSDTKVGALLVGDARLNYYRIYLDWFDYWLRGIDNGVFEMPKIRYYVAGSNEWRSSDRWPVREMRPRDYYLSGNGASRRVGDEGLLTRLKPAIQAQDSFVYDPGDPFPSRGGTICCTGNPRDQPGSFDQSDLEPRSDLLIYSTPPLDTGLTIAGSVKATLFVSSDAKDTDVTAKLLDVDPEGRSWNIANGIKRLRYRTGYGRRVWLAAGQVYQIELSLKATAYHFTKGHRIRLYVSSSDFPAYDRNLNTGGNNFDESAWVKARNSVHHGGRFPSRLVLPVVP